MLKFLKDIGRYFLLMSRVLSIPKKWSVFKNQLSLEFEKIGLNFAFPSQSIYIEKTENN